ncbi:MAG: TRAP transporter substrate-binding protein [Rhodospirillales bacterium]|nr:TRAP transporter substrate-binding protein [Rhodospirillales bacterium]
MRRRVFVKSAAVGAIGCAATSVVSAPAIAKDRRELTMIMTWPKNTPGVGVNAARFADNVTALTDGRLTIKLYGAGDVVPPFESLDAVSSGTADLCHSTPYYWVGKAKSFNYFTGIPFGLTAQELAAWIAFGGGQALWEEVYAPFNVQPFYAGSSGTQAGGWYRREIKTPDDFHGLKFRIAGLGGEVLRRMGATPVMIPPGEIAPALMSGAVDGTDWIGPWNDLAFGLYRAAKYYYMPGLLEPGPGLEIIVNKKVFDELASDLQAAIRVAATATANETLADFTFHNIVSLEPLLKEHGVELRRFSDEIVKVMAKHAAEVEEELAQSDALTAKIHDSFISFLTLARAYAPNAEGGYLAARGLEA